MAYPTPIEWTDATWNPIGGCSTHSPGCANCYAQALAGTRLALHPLYAGTTSPSKAGPVFNGHLTAAPDHHDVWTWPMRWRGAKAPICGPGSRSLIFVGDMADLFHEDRPFEVIDRVFAVMALCPHHTFLVLTKRTERMREYFTATVKGPWAGRAHVIDDAGIEHPMTDVHFRMNSAMCNLFPKAPAAALNFASKWADDHYPEGDGFLRRWPLPNVWLGVSVEDQPRADERIPHLLATPAAVRFISAEPLLSGIDLRRWLDGTTLFCNSADHVARWLLPNEISYLQAPDTNTVEAICPTCGHSAGAALAPRLDLVIAGSESGPHARPCDIAWARSLRDQCVAAHVKFFWKQHVINGKKVGLPELDGRIWAEMPG